MVEHRPYPLALDTCFWFVRSSSYSYSELNLNVPIPEESFTVKLRAKSVELMKAYHSLATTGN